MGHKHFFSFAFTVFLGYFPIGDLYAICKKSQWEHFRIKFSRVTLACSRLLFSTMKSLICSMSFFTALRIWISYLFIMLPYFLIQQVLKFLKWETSFQGFWVSLFLLARRSGCVGWPYSCRCGLHTIDVFRIAKIDVFVIGRKYFSFTAYFSPYFSIQHLWTCKYGI